MNFYHVMMLFYLSGDFFKSFYQMLFFFRNLSRFSLIFFLQIFFRYFSKYFLGIPSMVSLSIHKKILPNSFFRHFLENSPSVASKIGGNFPLIPTILPEIPPTSPSEALLGIFKKFLKIDFFEKSTRYFIRKKYRETFSVVP